MTKIIATLFFSALAMSGCTPPPPARAQQATSAANPVEEVSLERAKQLITSGQVESLFQPETGPVTLMLRDGKSVSFRQPQLDWVVRFCRDNGMDDIRIIVE